jgi:hypothetical protein
VVSNAYSAVHACATGCHKELRRHRAPPLSTKVLPQLRARVSSSARAVRIPGRRLRVRRDTRRRRHRCLAPVLHGAGRC